MGFLNPGAFVFAAFIAALIALYLWERSQRRFDVAALFLWDQVPDAVVQKSRFQPDTLFWLQLAGLAALLLGLANPYWATSQGSAGPQRSILVIDTSASMQALEGGTSRFDLARDAAHRVIRSLPPGSEVMLIGAAREPSVVAPFTNDLDSLTEALNEISASDTSSNVESAVAIAKRTADAGTPAASIHVFTDLPRDRVRAATSEHTSWWPVGSSDHNLAVAAVEVAQGRLQGQRDAVIRATVRNYSASEQHSSLTLSVSGQEFSQELFTIGPRDEANFRFTEIPTSGLVEVSLPSGDALPIDDRAFAWVRPTTTIHAGYLGKPSPLRIALLQLASATNALEITDYSPADHSDQPPLDLLILHGEQTSKALGIPSLSIGPAPEEGSRIGVSGSAQHVSVLDWNRDHPILEGIDPTAMRPFSSVAVTKAPAWAESILKSFVNGREVPLLLTGESDGQRRAILTADLGTDNLLSTDHETMLLLLINIIDWLASRADEPIIARTGESHPLSVTPVKIFGPRDKPLVPPSTAPLYVHLDRAGQYEIVAKDSKRFLYANFQDSSESDIGRPPPAPSAAIAESEPNTRQPHEGAQGLFYLAAAALLIGEWLFATRT